MSTHDLNSVASRPGWTLLDRKATVDLGREGWHAVVRAKAQPRSSLDRFHVAIVGADGLARHTHVAGSVAEAVRIAEAHIYAAA
jgi:hypothetical protein